MRQMGDPGCARTHRAPGRLDGRQEVELEALSKSHAISWMARLSPTSTSRMAPMLKHRWSLSHNYLAGITAGDWLRLLRDNEFAVDPAYWHRAAFISLISVMNSCYRRVEERRFGGAIDHAELAGPPLFILGHWRNGTTHLHNLLALDTQQFAFANTYQVVNPHTFLCSEAINRRLFASFLPKKRPMDNMALSFGAPQEDEFAPLLMTFLSPYLGVTFARREDYYSRYLTFGEATADEIDRWKRSLKHFMLKLTLKSGRPLVLKSPPHTARIKLLLETFPNARFVHIHREPYTVFQSFKHYFDTAMWYTYLQRPDLTGLDDRIIRRYNVMYDVFFEQRSLIPAGRYHEMSFEDLEREPERELKRLYDGLGLPGFEQLQPVARAYLESLTSYRKNRFEALPPDMCDRIATAWARSFQEWGYPTR